MLVYSCWLIHYWSVIIIYNGSVFSIWSSDAQVKCIEFLLICQSILSVFKEWLSDLALYLLFVTLVYLLRHRVLQLILLISIRNNLLIKIFLAFRSHFLSIYQLVNAFFDFGYLPLHLFLTLANLIHHFFRVKIMQFGYQSTYSQLLNCLQA